MVHKFILMVFGLHFLDNIAVERSLDQQTQVELMHKRRKILVQFCKLILHGILPIYEACIVLQFYTKVFFSRILGFNFFF